MCSAAFNARKRPKRPKRKSEIRHNNLAPFKCFKTRVPTTVSSRRSNDSGFKSISRHASKNKTDENEKRVPTFAQMSLALLAFALVVAFARARLVRPGPARSPSHLVGPPVVLPLADAGAPLGPGPLRLAGAPDGAGAHRHARDARLAELLTVHELARDVGSSFALVARRILFFVCFFPSLFRRASCCTCVRGAHRTPRNRIAHGKFARCRATTRRTRRVYHAR